MVSVAEMPEKTPSQIIVTGPEPIQKSETDRGMIEIEQLDFKYGAHQVLHDVNLSIPARAVTAFIGPSGCGKTTLLDVIAALVPKALSTANITAAGDRRDPAKARTDRDGGQAMTAGV